MELMKIRFAGNDPLEPGRLKYFRICTRNKKLFVTENETRYPTCRRVAVRRVRTAAHAEGGQHKLRTKNLSDIIVLMLVY